MKKVLRPERLDISPNTVEAPRAWRHWLATFKNFIGSLQRPDENLDKLRILTNFVAPEIYELFSDSNNYDEAITKLKAAYVKTPNEIFARHTLSSRKQRPEESLSWNRSRRNYFPTSIPTPSIQSLLNLISQDLKIQS